MKKSVPMWRALAAVALASAYTAITMHHMAKFALIQQATAYEQDIARLSTTR